ncbi:MAG: hemerythrin domain-containing protein [Gammaproteobacteria bacterium]|nr:hemerythrin domain-containing protein [Gammaproteobacteria bacterium]MBU1776943.1 hemerythrin domain-containing protein [Gammaproteobacteria bacterium]MBU1968584.1 hemerythrin domain-containing protein [Gammaproteobacteria bacterium]
MPSIAAFMTDKHKACDTEFARAEDYALSADWDKAGPAFETFHHDMAQHFRMEEDQLFPTLLAAGGPGGPVQIMLMEHEQMNDLLGQMKTALDGHDAQRYGGLSETLLIVMQQHNLKEEQILYPIADRILASESAAVLGRMQQV